LADPEHQKRDVARRVVITELGLVPAPEFQAAISSYFEYPVIGEADFSAFPVLENLLSSGFLRRTGLLPIELADDAVIIGTIDPFSSDTLAAVAYLVEKPVAPCLISQQDFALALQRLYEPAAEPGQAGDHATTETFVSEDDVQRLKDVASEAPIIRLVDRLMRTAVLQRASDIHIEPAVDGLRVRYRIDGVMAEVERLAPEMHAGVASRVKILAKLNIAERRMPQDGRIKIAVGGREIDLRISTSPCCTAKASSCASSTRSRSSSSSRLSASTIEPSRSSTSLSPCRTASSWSAARPGAARRPPSTRRSRSSTRLPSASCRAALSDPAARY
jgi:general secretion pathway protein E